MTQSTKHNGNLQKACSSHRSSPIRSPHTSLWSQPSSEQFGTWRMSTWESLGWCNEHKHCLTEGKATYRYGREVTNSSELMKTHLLLKGRDKSAAIAPLWFRWRLLQWSLLKAREWCWEKTHYLRGAEGAWAWKQAPILAKAAKSQH